jgi:hydroxyacylglutathione hydrolase
MPSLWSTIRARFELPTTLQVEAIPAFDDNYIWLIRAPKVLGQVVVVDPGNARVVQTVLKRDGLQLVGILVTHHHADHTGGIEALLASCPVPVYGPARESIPGNPTGVRQGQYVRMQALGLEFQVLDVPGHTEGHVAYYGHGALFCGDTLFSAGCGRLLGGTVRQMTLSLGQLTKLPDATKVYCAHEYTVPNLRFALTVEPDNLAARAHLQVCQALRQAGTPTLPSSIGLERRINPFLRLDTQTVKRAVALHAGHTVDSDTEIFAVLRHWKNHFGQGSSGPRPA